MKKENSFSSDSPSILKPVIIGFIIGLAVISLFVFGVDHPNPGWGSLWQVKPLIITPLAGALGGFVFFLILDYQRLKGFNKTVAIVLAILIFLIGLWLGVVLGLNGTMWD